MVQLLSVDVMSLTETHYHLDVKHLYQGRVSTLLTVVPRVRVHRMIMRRDNALTIDMALEEVAVKEVQDVIDDVYGVYEAQPAGPAGGKATSFGAGSADEKVDGSGAGRAMMAS